MESYYRVSITVIRAENLPQADGIVVVRAITLHVSLSFLVSVVCCIFSPSFLCRTGASRSVMEACIFRGCPHRMTGPRASRKRRVRAQAETLAGMKNSCSQLWWLLKERTGSLCCM